MSKIATQIWQRYDNNAFSGNFNDFSSKIYLKFPAKESGSQPNFAASFTGFAQKKLHSRKTRFTQFTQISDYLVARELAASKDNSGQGQGLELNQPVRSVKGRTS